MTRWLVALITTSGACSDPPPKPPAVAVPSNPIPADASTPGFVAPWRVDSVTVKRRAQPGWAVHVELMVSRLRDASGQLASKLSCLVGGNHMAEGQDVPIARGITVGERSGVASDYFVSRPLDLIPNQCELTLFVDVIDHEVGRHCIVPAGDDFKVSRGPCPQLAEVPPPVKATDRQIGSVPWRLDAVKPERRTDRKNFAVRIYLSVTRLREVPVGTELKSKLSCHVGATNFVEIGGLSIPSGPIQIGESAPTFGDHFIWANLMETPDRCELLVYAQMPGARPDVIDHEVGRACLVPKPTELVTTLGACPK